MSFIVNVTKQPSILSVIMLSVWAPTKHDATLRPWRIRFVEFIMKVKIFDLFGGTLVSPQSAKL